VSNGASITNQGAYSLEGQGNSIVAGAGSGTFENDGFFVKSQSLLADIGTVGIPFTNNNTIVVQYGVLNFTTVLTNTAEAKVNVVARGDGEVRGSNMIFEGASTLTGDGILRATGTLTWQGATMTGSGNVFIDPGATMLVQGGLTDSGFTVTNNFQVRWESGTITLNNGAVINNQTGAGFQAESNDVMNTTLAPGTFNNYGIFRKIQAGLPWGSTEIQVVFNSVPAQGQQLTTLDAQFGSIGLRGVDSAGNGGTIQAVLQVAADAQIEFGSFGQTITLLDGTVFSGAGTVRVTNRGRLTIANGASVTNSSTTTFEVGGSDNRLPGNTEGILFGNGIFVNNGTSNWRDGWVRSILQIKNYGQLNLVCENSNGPFTIDSSILTNFSAGTITWTGGGFLMQTQANMQRKSLIDNFGSFTFQTAGVISDGDAQLFQTSQGINNETTGTIQKVGGNQNQIDVTFQTAGTVYLNGRDFSFKLSVLQTGGLVVIGNGELLTENNYYLEGGTLLLSNTGQAVLILGGLGGDNSLSIGPGGTLGGFGFVGGSVTNDGTIDFSLGGAAPGALRIMSDFTQSASGTLKMRVLSAQNQQYDRLIIGTRAGAAYLAGTLQVSALPGFNPTNGDLFPIITYPAVIGNFNTPYQLPSWLNWSWVLDVNGLTLKVKQYGP
jgi:hypothetical protein